VLDEADRMIEAGHFAELENILRLTLEESKYVPASSCLHAVLKYVTIRDEEIPDENAADSKLGDMEDDDEDTKPRIVKDGLQTFVFSATLSKDLQRNVKKKFRSKGNKKHYKRDQKPATTLGAFSRSSEHFGLSL
jgi:ATP-dependent RNA helicase DDX24/MAK5